MQIQNLAYIGVETKKLSEWKEFGTKVLGLMIAESSTKDCLKLRMDDRPFRISLHRGKKEQFTFAGFELRDQTALNKAKEDLKKVKRGQELGFFNIGSTIILVFSNNFNPNKSFLSENKSVKFGEIILKI